MAHLVQTARAQAAGDGYLNPTRWFGLGVLGLCVLVLNLDLTVLNVALPVISLDVGASTSELQWINAAFLLTSVGLMLFAGAAGDRWGRRRTLLAGLLVFGAASLVGAWATSGELLIVSRALMGVGVSVVMPMTMSLISTMFGPAERGKAIGIWGATVAIGMPLGPIVGGLLLDHFWWGSVFLINVVTVALAVPLGLLWLPESRNPERTRVDVPGVLLSAVSVAALVYGLIEAQKGWARTSTLGWLAVGAVLLVVFVVRQRTAAAPLVNLSLFRDAGFSWPLVVMNLLVFAAAGVLFITPLYLQGLLGMDALDAGLRLIPFAVAVLLGSLVSDRLSGGIGARWCASGGLVFIAAGLALLSTVSPSNQDLVVFAALALVGAGVGLAQPSAMAVAMRALPRATVGSGSAVINSFRQVGGVFGIAVIGSVVSAWYAAGLPAWTDQLPGGLAGAVRSSVAHVLPAADALGGERGDALRQAASSAFTDAMSGVLLICAVIGVLAAVLAAIYLPRADSSENSQEENSQE